MWVPVPVGAGLRSMLGGGDLPKTKSIVIEGTGEGAGDGIGEGAIPGSYGAR